MILDMPPPPPLNLLALPINNSTYSNKKCNYSVSNSPTFSKHTHIFSKDIPSISRITSQLYLGNCYFTEKDLKELEITHILNISCKKDPEYTNIKSLFINIPDGGDLNEDNKSIDDYFQTTINFIEDAIEDNGKILVHCRMGISRSSSLVIAYLMKSLNKPYFDILNIVKEKRPIIDPCFKFVCKLLDYQKELEIKSPKFESNSLI